MKVVLAAARASHNRCMERIKRTTNEGIADMYRIVNGQLTDIGVRVKVKYRVKRKWNVRETDKTFFERMKNGFVPVT